VSIRTSLDRWYRGSCSDKAYDSRPMPKARSHIAALAEQHEKQSQKIEELERLIAEVRSANISSEW
jgi:hypothetical protein